VVRQKAFADEVRARVTAAMARCILKGTELEKQREGKREDED